MLKRLEKLLAEKGLTQAEFERLVGLAETRITRWKGGQGEPTARQAVRMARALEVPMEWLVSDEGPDEPPSQAPPALTPDERIVLEFYRRSGLPHGVVADLIMAEFRRTAPGAPQENVVGHATPAEVKAQDAMGEGFKAPRGPKKPRKNRRG